MLLSSLTSFSLLFQDITFKQGNISIITINEYNNIADRLSGIIAFWLVIFNILQSCLDFHAAEMIINFLLEETNSFMLL